MKRFNWMFWKKEEPPSTVLAVLTIPPDRVLRVLELVDAYNAIKPSADKVARYNLWMEIYSIFPEAKRGQWEIDTKDAVSPVLRELDELS